MHNIQSDCDEYIGEKMKARCLVEIPGERKWGKRDKGGKEGEETEVRM